MNFPKTCDCEESLRKEQLKKLKPRVADVKSVLLHAAGDDRERTREKTFITTEIASWLVEADR